VGGGCGSGLPLIANLASSANSTNLPAPALSQIKCPLRSPGPLIFADHTGGNPVGSAKTGFCLINRTSSNFGCFYSFAHSTAHHLAPTFRLFDKLPSKTQEPSLPEHRAPSKDTWTPNQNPPRFSQETTSHPLPDRSAEVESHREPPSLRLQEDTCALFAPRCIHPPFRNESGEHISCFECHCGIITENIIIHFHTAHRLQHGRGRSGHSITPEIDQHAIDLRN
jgi:hypothetical protein